MKTTENSVRCLAQFLNEASDLLSLPTVEIKDNENSVHPFGSM